MPEVRRETVRIPSAAGRTRPASPGDEDAPEDWRETVRIPSAACGARPESQGNEDAPKDWRETVWIPSATPPPRCRGAGCTSVTGEELAIGKTNTAPKDARWLEARHEDKQNRLGRVGLVKKEQ
mmetsp:Transcript_5745/g.12130  ORF Transcript_5745/g.12130 Transcript_5745/m.12130 type:complete len:124 (-) Transcript_5745:56-427(-)